MARPLRIEYPGAYYHITSRGNERKEIFKSANDREKFLTYLEASAKRYGAVIHVYCLMNNHYHLLLETPFGNLSQIMRYINGSYTTYFNTKQKRCGHLFQGRYKAIVIDADEYAAELSRYIHLNPVKAGVVDRPEEYKWSSYRYYIGNSKRPEGFRVDLILGYFGKNLSVSQKGYSEFTEAMIRKKYESPLKDAVAATILGSVDFVDEIKERYLNDKKTDRNTPLLRELMSGPTIEEVLKEAKAILGNDAALSRKAVLYLCHMYSRRTLKEIGAYFGISESGVSQASNRFKLVLDSDIQLRKKIEDIGKRLKVCNV